MASAKSPASFRPCLNRHLLQEAAWACSLAPLSSLAASIAHLTIDCGLLGPARGAMSQVLGQGSQNMTDALTRLPTRASLSGLGRLLAPGSFGNRCRYARGHVIDCFIFKREVRLGSRWRVLVLIPDLHAVTGQL